MSTTRPSIGVQLQPQATTMDELRAAARAADEMGADSIWVWDHFFALFGDDPRNFECYTLLAGLAVETTNARLGALVTCNSYRNPNLLADMSRTIDHLSGGRFTLGIGSGWFEKDYEAYDYEFGTAIGRLRDLERDLPIIKDRLSVLDPAPVGPLPILVGGGGEKVTLRIVAEHADGWNAFGSPEEWGAKNRILDEWCERVERNPSDIERTIAIMPAELDQLDAYVEAGADHVILMVSTPFDLDPLAAALDAR